MKRILFVHVLIVMAFISNAQQGIVNTSNSGFAKLSSTGMGDVQWTRGFWAERFAICRDSMVPGLWSTYNNASISHAFKNFQIAAGLDTGVFKGPSFHDGDFYKTLEAVAAMYSMTKDPALDKMMDDAIAVIAKAQKTDGYIYTRSIIDQRRTGKTKMFDDKLSFEAYNFGHLMTAACVHYRATGKKNLLDVATKAADFLINFYAQATPEEARNAICPSHYMGLVELYRTTGDKKYLALAERLINIRGTVEGTDDNSDRSPFRSMQRVVGHAVRANYLFAGAADVYAEDGDTSLLSTLNRMWDDVVHRKMYITGGCGSLYDGVSVDGTSYNPDTVQKIHQAYGRDFQLPNLSAHNETCANIGNLLWNWRMFQVTGEEKYMDVVELELYNGILSGVSLDGTKFFYTNPLAASADYPYDLRWQGGRQSYIALSNCCPPNAVRTIAETANYVYSISNDGIYINLYSGNNLNTTLKDGSPFAMTQETNYPWDGKVRMTITQSTSKNTSVYLRIPEWCKKATVLVNGKMIYSNLKGGKYQSVQRTWHKGDRIDLILDMPATLIQSNPLVEETRGQVAIKRGPIVYSLESKDLTNGNVFDVLIPASVKFHTVPMKIGNATIMALEGNAKAIKKNNWDHALYKELNSDEVSLPIRLIPYYAWSNRGKSEMTVWMPLTK